MAKNQTTCFCDRFWARFRSGTRHTLVCVRLILDHTHFAVPCSSATSKFGPYWRWRWHIFGSRLLGDACIFILVRFEAKSWGRNWHRRCRECHRSGRAKYKTRCSRNGRSFLCHRFWDHWISFTRFFNRRFEISLIFTALWFSCVSCFKIPHKCLHDLFTLLKDSFKLVKNLLALKLNRKLLRFRFSISIVSCCYPYHRRHRQTMWLQLNIRPNRMISTDLTHLISSHQNPAVTVFRIVTQFHFSSSAFFPLLCRRIKPIKLSMMSEEMNVAFFSCRLVFLPLQFNDWLVMRVVCFRIFVSFWRWEKRCSCSSEACRCWSLTKPSWSIFAAVDKIRKWLQRWRCAQYVGVG